MENKVAFDLNSRLREWRCTLKNRPAIREDDIEELEAHLRDTMDALSKSGLSQEEAFFVGARRVGHPVELEDQFSCARPAVVWKDRAQWMVLGILSWWVASGLTTVGTSLTLWFGRPFSDGYALGWIGLGVQMLLILCFGWLAFRVITRNRSNASAERSRPGLPSAARWIIYLSIGCVVLGIGGVLLQALAIRETEPSTFAMCWAVTVWGRSLLLPAGIIAAGLWLATSSRPKSAGGIAVLLLAGLLVGCNQGGNSANPPTPAHRAAGFEACLELIKTDSNAAVDAFLDLNLTQGKLFAPGSALSYSESEFVNLPAAAREKLGQQATDDLARVKQLATEVRSRRNAARTAGDTALAVRYNTQLAKLGERLERPDNLKLTQLVGRAVARMAAE